MMVQPAFAGGQKERLSSILDKGRLAARDARLKTRETAQKAVDTALDGVTFVREEIEARHLARNIRERLRRESVADAFSKLPPLDPEAYGYLGGTGCFGGEGLFGKAASTLSSECPSDYLRARLGGQDEDLAAFLSAPTKERAKRPRNILMRKYHPDHNGNNPDIVEISQAINLYYQQLP